ncbi:tubulin monoglutamylase TTLL4-like isoform X3 [Ischnura elegans]|uniref:tubulin monoglutamylase TTLL4-like isoform X3 n=1 Tax=Ischnura elegans TaxID=197161 RepID=UPI001ED8A34B|nr:tubulin monoglutamylase TTLL4-like isoform X3 [Ischnura elegans]
MQKPPNFNVWDRIMMAYVKPGTSRGEESREYNNYDDAPPDSVADSYQKVLGDRRKRDVGRVKASHAAINKRRLQGAQGSEVAWEDKQLPISSGQHSSEPYRNNYAQYKKPLTELTENPSGGRKPGNSPSAGCENYTCLQNGKYRNVYELALFEDVLPYANQDIDSAQISHSILPKVAMKRVNSDDALNEFLGRGFNQHIFSLNKNYKGIKFRKSRENLEIRRRHSSVGGYLSGDEFSCYSRRTMWRKYSNCQVNLNSPNGEIVKNADFLNDLVGYDEDKDLIQEKRICRSGIGDISLMKDELHNNESKFFDEHSIPSKYLFVNESKLFVRGDFASHMSASDCDYFNKVNSFGEDLCGTGIRTLGMCRPRFSVNEMKEGTSLGNWSNFSDMSSCFSVVGQHMNCDVPLNIMTNVYSSSWTDREVLKSVSITKSLGELKMSPIYQSHGGAILSRKSSDDWPVHEWPHRRCLPKIPQIWKEEVYVPIPQAGSKKADSGVESCTSEATAAANESEDPKAVGNEEPEDNGRTEQSKDLPVAPESMCENKVDKSEESDEPNEARASHLPLRVSLFPYVPPYIQFAKHDEKGPPIHEDIKSIAKWKLGKFTPSVVQLIIKNTGFDLVRHCDEFVGSWAKNLSPSGFSHVKESQKINHIPGGFYIGRKDSLCNNLKKMKNVYGAAEYYFVPETYVLPGDIYFLKQEWNEAEEKKESTKWIVKPPAGARGSGVAVIHSWGQIPHSKPIVVQKYIANPYLIDSTKFDLRVYVLITSVHPLRLYVYEEGLVRFASDVYSPDTSTLSDKYVHLTNYSVNKKSSRYMANQDPSACQGHKWTLSSLWSFLREKNINVDGLWEKIVDIAIKTFLSGESAISRCSNTCLSSNYPAYELFGLDIILDDELKPWLLEVNISPSLNTASKLDMSVKGPMMSELLNLVGYHLPPSNQISVSCRRKLIKQLMGAQLNEEAEGSGSYPGLVFDKRIYTKALSSEEKRKQLMYTEMYSNQMKYIDSILRILMPDDVRHLLISEDELSQADRFQRVFPSAGMQKYYKFFNGPRYYNMLHEAWEKRYHQDRKAGIELLQELCRNRLHLRTPLSMSSIKYGAKVAKAKETLNQKSSGVNSKKKSKDEVSWKKFSENASKKISRERVSVKIKKRSNLTSASFSSTTSGRPRNIPTSNHPGGFKLIRKAPIPSPKKNLKRGMVKVLGAHHIKPAQVTEPTCMNGNEWRVESVKNL